jgi:hypothetical protein
MKKILLFTLGTILLLMQTSQVRGSTGGVISNIALGNGTNNYAKVLPGATVQVCMDAGGVVPVCITPVTLYLDMALTPTTPPITSVTADANGNYSFFVPVGNYVVSISALGYTSALQRVVAVDGISSQVFDPASPGPIGGTTPSTVNATTVTAITATVSGPIVSTGGFISADQYVLAPIYFGSTVSNPINAPNGITAGGTNTFNQISVTGSFTLVGGTPMTSQSSANSQIVTCPPGGTSTQYCGADGAWHTIGSGGTVTSVTATAPVASTGGTTPQISIPQATTSADGYLSHTDWNTFNGKQAALTNPTTQGNTFNGASQLVQMTSGAKLPAVDGSLLTNLPSGGGVTLTGTYSASYPMYYATSATTMAPDLTFNYNYSTGLHTFSQDVAFVSSLNPSYSATFHIPYLGANRTYTYPDATGNVVLDSATQTLTNKTVDGVTPTVFGYLDPTSSVQTQLNAMVPTTQTVNGHALSAPVVVSASDLTTGTLPASAEPAHTGDMTNSAGSLATSVVKVNGITPGGACTNQFARSISSSAVPTCASIAAADLTATVIPAVAVPTPGTSITLAAPSGFAICTGTCTVSIPVPAAGYQFCIMNDDNVSTAITLSALGSSARYENTARTAYGTAGTGTLAATAAAGNMVCIVGRDSTHYLTTNYVGTWTAN